MSSEFQPNDGSLDGEEISGFDPRTLTAEQRRALEHGKREKIDADYDDHLADIRSNVEGAEDYSKAEFLEKYVNPTER